MTKTKRWVDAQTGEKKWWSNYKSQDNSETDCHTARYSEAVSIMSKTKDFSDEDLILDVGCGPGDFLNLIQSGFTVGLEPLLPYFKKQQVINNTIQGVQAISERTPFKPNTFSKIFCYNVLDHVVNADGTLNEIYTILHPDGYFLLAVDVHSPLAKFRRIFFEVTGIKRDIYHPHSFTSKDIENKVKLLGFRIINSKVIFEAESPNRFMRLIDKAVQMKSHYFLCLVLKKQ